MTQFRLYQVEIWAREFVIRDYFQTTEFKFKEDYMDPEKNNIKSPTKNALEGDYIRIYNIFNQSEIYTGIITGAEEKKGQITITYEPFMSLLDIDIVAHWETATSYSVEEFIATRISETYLTNPDAMQNIAGIATEIETVTPYIADGEKEEICNLYDDIIIPAFYEHAIRLIFTLDIAAKSLKVSIGQSQKKPLTIEADLPNVTEKKVVIKKTNKTVNKVIVYSEDMLSSAEFYRYDENGSRILPVEYTIETINVKDGEVFEDLAKEKANGVFAKTKYENLIEVECQLQDWLITPEKWEIGQEATIISEGTAYSSTYTGREIGDTVRLIFGTIRMELTKKIKGRG